MKVFVNYPVMITPGVYHYATQELDMTVEQVPYATEGIDHNVVFDHDGLFICVKSDEAVEKLTMMRKDVLSRKVAMEKDSKLSEQLCNVINAVTCAVDQIHRHKLRNPDVVIDHLRARTDIYGGLSEEVLQHVDTILTNILCKKDQDDMDDYYSDFDLQ